jgi:glycosyltransferase involved in cell wall biosynthesis
MSAIPSQSGTGRQTVPLSAFQALDGANRLPCGALDGLTIMRYAHMYRDRASGGVEQYLRLLNRGLLQRSRATILQMYLTRDFETDYVDEEMGLGRIIWMPVLPFQINSRVTGLIGGVSNAYGRVRDCRRGMSGARPRRMLPFLNSLARHSVALLRYKRTVFSDRMACLLATHSVDLLALHWLSRDTQALIASAACAGTPFVLINHFENARLASPRVRKWIANAAGIAGVSGPGLPEDLRGRFVNLSDAVDTEFFSPEKTPYVGAVGRPVILMPARIAPGKGHHDMMEAAKALAASQLDFELWFAGAVESESLRAELHAFAADPCMRGRVEYLGEVNPQEMRERYARSALVVLPSQSEGLPRTLLEAQAMKKPVVTYDSGGTSDALLPSETGFLVPAGRISNLAEKIALLITDDALRQRMGELGRQHVLHQFSTSALIDRHERFYLSALSKRLNVLR